MKRLHIDEKYREIHNKYYKNSLLLALDELARGKALKFKDQRCTKTLKLLKGKKTSQVKGCGICYVRLVKALLSKYDILVAEPYVLQRCVFILDRFDRTIRKKVPEHGKKASNQVHEYEDAKKLVEELFNYGHFGAGKRLYAEESDPSNGVYFTWKPMKNWSAWDFMQTLEVGACAYCNGGGVFSLRVDSKLPGSSRTVINDGDKKRSPFDHFFGHTKYPCLGLSLFNLVPSCTRCNTNMKGATGQDIYSFVHPYLQSFDDGAKFYALFEKYNALALPMEQDVCVVLRPALSANADRDLEMRAGKSAVFFHLEEVYNQTYGRELVDIVRRVVAIPQAYWDDLKGRFPGIDISVANRMLIGCSLDRNLINKERLSKLTCDLWDQLHVDIFPTDFLTQAKLMEPISLVL